MRNCFLFPAILILLLLLRAQSPYLSVSVKMDTTNSFHYKIEMKLCDLTNPTRDNDAFTHDSSVIKFDSLKTTAIKCGNYFETDDELKSEDQFHFGNQIFAFEKILVFKITDVSHRNWIKPMYLVLPIKNKSFDTFVELTELSFKEGSVVYIDQAQIRQEEMKLYLRQSLKNFKTVLKQDFSLKAIL